MKQRKKNDIIIASQFGSLTLNSLIIAFYERPESEKGFHLFLAAAIVFAVSGYLAVTDPKENMHGRDAVVCGYFGVIAFVTFLSCIRWYLIFLPILEVGLMIAFDIWG